MIGTRLLAKPFIAIITWLYLNGSVLASFLMVSLWADENNFMSSNVTDPIFVLLAGQKQKPLDVELGQIFRGFFDTNLT